MIKAYIKGIKGTDRLRLILIALGSLHNDDVM